MKKTSNIVPPQIIKSLGIILKGHTNITRFFSFFTQDKV